MSLDDEMYLLTLTNYTTGQMCYLYEGDNDDV